MNLLTKMRTKATDKLPDIEWECLELLEKDVDERMEVYNAIGSDANGNDYSGSAYFFCDIFEDVKDIETD